MVEFSEQPLSKTLCLLIEDQKQTVDFLKKALESAFPGIQVAAQHSSRETREWLISRKEIKTSTPLGLVLVDLGLPDGSGIEVIRYLSEQEPQARIVVITIYDDDAYLFEALAAGASGYILKEEEPKFLIEILKRLEKNEPPLSPSIARRLLMHFREPQQTHPTQMSELTARERETLTLLARGLTVAESAKQMGLSAQTVAGYVKIIYQKLHVSNRVEATREAIRRGLV